MTKPLNGGLSSGVGRTVSVALIATVPTFRKRPTTRQCQAAAAHVRKFFSVRTGTAMQDSKIGYQKWAIAFYLMATGIKGVSSMKLHRDLA